MHFDSRKINRSTFAAFSAALLLSGCGGSDKSTGPAANSVAKVLESFTVQGGGSAAVKTGAPPTGSSGPVVTVTSSASVAQGGSSEVVVSSTTAFKTIFVSVEGKDGYYEITLPASVTTATLLETFGTTLSGAVVVHYAAATAAGAVGVEISDDVNIIDVGNGDIQIAVSWDTPTDVDLHVVDPSGEDTYYGNSTSTAGGSLDLDSNAGCGLDNKNNENITWTKTPASGTYTVRVDYWSACGVTTATNYTVTVRRKGKATQVFTGAFTGSGDNGGDGSGTTITTFSYP